MAPAQNSDLPNAHGDGFPPRPRQLKRACVVCHSRKVRCDGVIKGFPCTNCKDAGLECAVAERRRRKRKAAVNVLSPNSPGVGRSVTTDTDLNDDENARTIEPFAAATPGTNQAPNRAQNGTDSQGDSERELAEQHLVGFFSQDLQHSPIRARLTYVGNELSNLNFLTRQRTSNHHVYHYPCDNPYVPRVYKSARPTETASPIPKDAFILPPKHIADILVEAFFESIYPIFPIINKEGFLALYHDDRSSPSLLLLQAVCLAGAHTVKVFKNNQELKVALFRRSKALLEGRYEEDRMEMVQAALLLTWFSDGGDDVCANAWWWIGIAARTAIGLGMHREVGPSKMPAGDKRTWRRIWWCLAQFDCIASLCYGRSQTINLDDCDVPPLQQDDFEESISRNDADFVMHHARLCVIVSDLMRTQFTVKATKHLGGRGEALKALDTQIAAWFLELPSELRDTSGVHKDDGGARPHSLLLHLTYNAILIQFHRLLVNRSAGDASGMDSRAHEDICTEAASNILQIFEQLVQRSSLHRCWFSAPSFLFSAMLQVRTQTRSSNPILALRAEAREKSGLRSLRSMSRYWLFATSIWRLFRSNSITTAATAAATPNAASADLDSPGQASSVTTAPSMHLVPLMDSAQEETGAFSQITQAPLIGGETNTMDWTHFVSATDSAPSNAYMNEERLQQNLNEWQYLYWNDPLADMSLSNGSFDLQWSL